MGPTAHVAAATVELDALRLEKVLKSKVRKPPDAEAYHLVTLADAEREATNARAQAQTKETTLRGKVEASATEATGLAEAASIEARATALAKNQDAVIAQQTAEHNPGIAKAVAEAMSNIDNLVVLNGGEGMADLLAQAITVGGAGIGLARQLMEFISGSASGPTKVTDV